MDEGMKLLPRLFDPCKEGWFRQSAGLSDDRGEGINLGEQHLDLQGVRGCLDQEAEYRTGEKTGKKN